MGMPIDNTQWHLPREHLPYGLWTCKHGREVLFNRSYWPIWERWPGEFAVRANPEEFVLDIVSQAYFFDDADRIDYNNALHTRLRKILVDFIGVPAGTPYEAFKFRFKDRLSFARKSHLASRGRRDWYVDDELDLYGLRVRELARNCHPYAEGRGIADKVIKRAQRDPAFRDVLRPGQEFI